MCLQGPQRSVLGSLLEASCDLFCSLPRWVCPASEKECPRTVFHGESVKAWLAKTCKRYSTSFENRVWAPDAVRLPSWSQNTFILPSSSYLRGPYTDTATHVVLVLHTVLGFWCSLSRLGVHFGVLLARAMGDPAAQNCFFSGLGSVCLFFWFQVASGGAFG